jgi:two-component system chemotaxis sensor kinase CheA
MVSAGLRLPGDPMDDLLPLFLSEARESLALLADDLALLAEQPEDAGARARARRVLHTLKGSCGFLGLDAIADLAHRGEDLLDGAGELGGLGDIVAAIARCLDDLGPAMATPAPTPWAGLAALGADLARKLGKGFDLVVEDHGVVPDPGTARALGRMLPHLLRNAAGHGLEPPAERSRAGKPARGRLTVAAALENNRMTVTVSDDGRGIDLDALGRAAARRGLAAPERIAAMSAAETAALAFAPGVTTVGAVTLLAGRGIGLDAVRHEVEALGGAVTIETAAGRGTTVVLTLPQPAAASARAA